MMPATEIRLRICSKGPEVCRQNMLIGQMDLILYRSNEFSFHSRGPELNKRQQSWHRAMTPKFFMRF
jgi:hypothetical protein